MFSNDPGQYPGRPAAGTGFVHQPGCGKDGEPCYCFVERPRPPYTPEQAEAQGHVNRLRIINLVLFFPFLITALFFITLTADPPARHRYFEILPGILALIILVFVIRNKVVKGRLRHHYNVR